RARDQTLRPALTLAGRGGEAPAVVSADERVAFELAFSEERPLMRAEPVVGAKTQRGADDHELPTRRAHRMRTLAGQIAGAGHLSPFGRAHGRAKIPESSQRGRQNRERAAVLGHRGRLVLARLLASLE